MELITLDTKEFINENIKKILVSIHRRLLIGSTLNLLCLMIKKFKSSRQEEPAEYSTEMDQHGENLLPCEKHHTT